MGTSRRLNVASGRQLEKLAHYSRALRVGDTVLQSGTTAIDRQGNVHGEGDVARQVDAIIEEGIARGLRTIGLPWEMASVEGHDGFYQTGRISSERFRQTPVERLAHELVHASILAQLQ